jgi:secondary thiamine-phosphate synthase enzyme
VAGGEVRVFQHTVGLTTRGRGFYDLTRDVAEVVADSGVTSGLCVVFVRHTSASLLIQENADPAVLRDMGRWMERLAPEDSTYEHDAEGPDDMPSHLRASVTRTSESVPVVKGKLALGSWQAIYLWEHRTSSHRREIVIHVSGV